MAKTLEELHTLIDVDPVELELEKDALRERQRAWQLRELRSTAGLTQSAMAQLMDVRQNRVSQIETGGVAHTKLETLKRYAEALGGRLTVEISLGDTTYKVA